EDITEAAKRATATVGGGYIETASQRIIIRAKAPGESTDDLANAMVAMRAGLPVRLRYVATIRDGIEPRFGDALIDGQPGIMVETSTQFGANTLEVTRALEQRLVALLLAALRDWRGALISFSAIPLTLLTTVWILDTFGLTLNTMTLGGLV